MKSGNFWNTISRPAWQKVPPPWKPDSVDLIMYLFFIFCHSFFSKRPILLLGATQELRSLLSLLHIKYDMIDTSAHMESITRPNGKDSLNTFFNTPWEEYSPKKRYSLVIGDLILNLSSEEYVKRILNKEYGGPLVLRTRLATCLTYEEVSGAIKKNLATKDKQKGVSFFYSLLASTQTLTLVFNKTEEEALATIFQKQDSSSKNFFKETYLKHSPQYYLHKEQFLGGETRKSSVRFWLKRTHPLYVDTFCFLFKR